MFNRLAIGACEALFKRSSPYLFVVGFGCLNGQNKSRINLSINQVLSKLWTCLLVTMGVCVSGIGTAQQGTSAGCLITTKPGQVLFVKDGWSKRWSLPGGRCGAESARQCAIRETVEEIGMAVEARGVFLKAERFVLFRCVTQEPIEYYAGERNIENLWVPLSGRHEVDEVALIEPGKDFPWTDSRWKFLSGSILLRNQMDIDREPLVSESRQVEEFTSRAAPYELAALRLNSRLQQYPDLSEPLKFFSFLSEEFFFLILIPFLVLIAAIDEKRVWHFGLLIVFTIAFNSLLKFGFLFARPSDFVPAAAGAAFRGHGFPSGHTMLATAAWTYLMSLYPKWWTGVLGALIIFMVGVSRMYLGVHFYHDVLAGLVCGGISLYLVKLITSHFSLINFTQFLMVFLLCLAVFCFALDPNTFKALWVVTGFAIAFKVLGLNCGAKKPGLFLGVLYFVSSLVIVFSVRYLFELFLPTEGYTVYYIAITAIQYFVVGFITMFFPFLFRCHAIKQS